MSSVECRVSSFTLVELVIGAAVLAIAIAALLGAWLGQLTLNEHARNLTWAMNDANRVMERLRQLNTGCTSPTSTVPAGAGCDDGTCNSWDEWLNSTVAAGSGGGKSVQPSPTTNELVLVQQTAGPDPLQITVAICWRHRGRVLGECNAALAWVDGTAPYTANGIPESPAMLTTLMTCRQ